MSSSSGSDKEEVIVLENIVVEQESSEDPPMSDWSSLEMYVPETNRKRFLYSKGLYSPGSGEICSKYVAMSESAIFRQPYYNYPAVLDPGIQEALLMPETPVRYPDDGQDLYITLCKEMNICPIGEFYRGLLKDKITLRYYGVNPVGVRAMAIALRLNKYVRKLDLTDNFLTEDGSYHLGKMLTDNTYLEELCLEGCRIGPKGAKCISISLSSNSTLEVLNLGRNCLGDDGALHLAKELFEGINILQLNLSYNNLGTKAAFALGDAFDYTSKLTHLDLSWNQLYSIPSTVKLLSALAESVVLEELNLAWNSLGGDRIAVAIKLVLLIPSLKGLDLSNNKFTDNVIPIITANLIKAKKLTTLNLSCNPLSPSGAYYVLQTLLKPRVKIQRLMLDEIWISKEFLWCLDRVLRMKSRKDAIITYGGLIRAYTIVGPDTRLLILQRADFLGNRNKKKIVDVAQFFLRLNKSFTAPVEVKVVLAKRTEENVPLDDALIMELADVFPGPRTAKSTTISLALIAEYMKRIWPERKLPPTPPPEPEIVAEPSKGKGKKGKGKK